MAENVKRRRKKTNHQQMEIIVEFINNNKEMISARIHPLAIKNIEDKWVELTELLNAVPNGARKMSKHWKIFFSEWKSKVRKKVRTNKTEMTGTGGGAYISNSLTDLENRLMGLIGWITMTGHTDMPAELAPSDQNKVHPESEEQAEELEPEEIMIEVEDVEFDEETMENNSDTDNVINENASAIPIQNKRAIKKEIPNKSKSQQGTSSATRLEHSAELYHTSSIEMAESIKSMAKSIELLAKSFSELAIAIKSLHLQK